MPGTAFTLLNISSNSSCAPSTSLSSISSTCITVVFDRAIVTKSWAFRHTCPLSIAWWTIRLIVPPKPSTTPFPWEVAKKCHDISTLYIRERCERFLKRKRCLNWDAAPSEKNTISCILSSDRCKAHKRCSSAAWIEYLLCSTWLETKTNERLDEFRHHAWAVNRDSCFFEKCALCISSCSIIEKFSL